MGFKYHISSQNANFTPFCRDGLPFFQLAGKIHFSKYSKDLNNELVQYLNCSCCDPPVGPSRCCSGTTIHIVPTKEITKLRQTSRLNETQV